MFLIDGEKRFELAILGREFPNSTEYHDGNWLNVEVKASDGDLHWTAKDNCLLAYELHRLRQWVGDLYGTSEKEIRFTENELAFEFNKDTNTLTVVLDFHLHPKGQNYDYGEDGDDEYLLNFSVDERKLKSLILDLGRLIDKYPVKERPQQN